MKYIIRLLLFAVISLIAYGLSLNQDAYQAGDKYIGIGILTMSFLLMPLFIYHRYKNKKLEDFMVKKTNTTDEN
jgi:predicted permease